MKAVLLVAAAFVWFGAFGSTWTVFNEDHLPWKSGKKCSDELLSPCRQLAYAVQNASSGDAIDIKAGVYDFDSEGVAPMEVSGDKNGPAYLLANNKRLVLRGEKTSHWSVKSAAEETVLKGASKARLFYGYAGSGRGSSFLHLTFEGGTAGTAHGGAVFFAESSGVVPYEKGFASNCVFRSNSATHGGALYRVSAYDCLFDGNSSTGAGGAANGDGKNDFVGCVFRSNSSSRNNVAGGALYLDPAGIIEGNLFTNNVATKFDGGALAVNSIGTRTSVSNCVFVGNKVTSGSGSGRHGGAIMDFTGSLVIRGCAFTNNTATGNGGAVRNAAGIEDCTFAGNTAGVDGGAVYTDSAMFSLAGCTFATNAATTGCGGAVVCTAFSLVTNCTVVGNSAGNKGGGLFATTGDFLGTVIDSTFADNTNAVGAASQLGTHVAHMRDLIDCRFSGWGNPYAVNYEKCVFSRCVYPNLDDNVRAFITFNADTGTGRVRNCLFETNAVTCLLANAGVRGEVDNCTFVGNSVPYEGCLFWAFRAGSSSSGYVGGTNVIRNCVFAGGRKADASGAWQDGDVSFYRTQTYALAANIVSNAIYEVRGADYADKDGALVTSEFVRVDDVRFVAGREDEEYAGQPYYQLARGSRGRNRGLLLDWMDGATDLAGRPRISDGRVDMGCYESAYVAHGCILLFR